MDMPMAASLPPRATALDAARTAGGGERELEDLDDRRIGLTLYRRVLSEALDEADDRAAGTGRAGCPRAGAGVRRAGLGAAHTRRVAASVRQ
jgi:hypothetical protein